MRKREMGELFEVFADPRPSGASALRNRKGSSGFKKFLEARGEYPFKDDGLREKFNVRRMFQVKTETLLVLALAFLIANIASFSIGVWNGKRGSVDAAVPAPENAVQATGTLSDPAGPIVKTEPVPEPRRTLGGEGIPVTPKPKAPPVAEGKYTIRVMTLGLSQTKDAREHAEFFVQRGYRPAKVRRVGSKLVVEVGAF
ncbi:MAG: hypothetical protein ACYS47_18860, partial [Planctomycetota bacterium]